MKTNFFWIFLLVLNACANQQTDAEQTAAEESIRTDQDYFRHKVAIDYAENFQVTYHNNYKVVKTKVKFGTAAQDADSLAWERAFTDVMVLVQRGTPIPSLTGDLEGAHVIEIPVNTIAGNADDAPTRFIALNITDKLVGLGHDGVYDEKLRSRFEAGELQPIGASWHTGPNLEVLLAAQPDVTLLTAASLTQSNGIKKTRELGLKAAPEFSWSETTYLGQLEWIKYDALFVNEEAAANTYFTTIKNRCDSLQKLVQDRMEKPGVLWGMHHKSGSWTLRANGSIAQLIEAAGATNPFADNQAAVTETKANGLSEGIQVSDEIVLGKAQEIDYIISFQSTTENWPPDSYMNSFPAFRNQNLFHHFKRYRDYGAHDWYQTAPMRPDLLLMDLIHLFHPEVLPKHELFFLEPIQIL